MSTTGASARRVETLALLVGSNPLPNYLAAMMLEPREVTLLYSPQTTEPRDLLRAALEQKNITLKDVCVDDATDARKIRDACQGLVVDHLHYSGGTKSMAAHARQACNLSDSQASYLDERKGLLRFDDGYDVRLDQCELGLTLDLLLKLHGIDRVAATEKGAGLPTDDDALVVATGILQNPSLVDVIRQQLRPEERKRSFTQTKSAPWRPQDDGLTLSASVVPGEDWTSARYNSWMRFLTGGWLEAWTARLVRACLDGPAQAIEVSVDCNRARPSPTQFEIDVALIRGHRLHVVSCTTHQKKPLCKSKLFEVTMRARQMGGDLARSALVSLLDGSDTNGPYVDQLRADIASIWDSPNIPKVFGLADLREWAGTTGADANLGTLKEWLES